MTTNYITYRHYTKDEINYLKEKYTGDKENVFYLAKKLKRSECSIRNQAKKYNLTHKKIREKFCNITSLTRTERKILNLLYKGLNVKEIAQICCVSLNTVKTHKTNILHKTDTNSIIELLAKRIKELEQQQSCNL